MQSPFRSQSLASPKSKETKQKMNKHKRDVRCCCCDFFFAIEFFVKEKCDGKKIQKPNFSFHTQTDTQKRSIDTQ